MDREWKGDDDENDEWEVDWRNLEDYPYVNDETAESDDDDEGDNDENDGGKGEFILY